MARDKRMAIAVLIIVVLVLILGYVLFIGPKVQGYVIKKETQAQQNIVSAIIQVVDQQGYVSLTDGNASVVLVKYIPQDQQANPSG